MINRKISVSFTNCGIALVAVNPGILVIFGSAFVSLFFFHDVTHIQEGLVTKSKAPKEGGGLIREGVYKKKIKNVDIQRREGAY